MRPREDHRGETGRERVGAADALAEGVRGAGPGEIPARLCDVAVALLPVTGASVSLHSDGMPVRLGASSAQAAYVTDIQATLGDGPCQSAAASGAPVLACDLTAGRDVLRWPVFAQQATAAGVRAVYSMPLGNDTVCVGTLDLCRDTPGDLTDRDVRTARVVAGMMTVALMALPRAEDAGDPGDERWLSGLATDQDQVYQATGMIMAQLGVGTEEALVRLRAYAFAHGRMAVEVAGDVVEHRLRFDREHAWTPCGRPAPCPDPQTNFPSPSPSPSPSRLPSPSPSLLPSPSPSPSPSRSRSRSPSTHSRSASDHHASGGRGPLCRSVISGPRPRQPCDRTHQGPFAEPRRSPDRLSVVHV